MYNRKPSTSHWWANNAATGTFKEGHKGKRHWDFPKRKVTLHKTLFTVKYMGFMPAKFQSLIFDFGA